MAAARQTPHRTPLRRISQGSLFALSRSNTYPDAPHGLGFLEPALSELADETEALQANAEALRGLGNALNAFNEGFASWLYVMDMNALTVDWPRAPTDASFELARRRAEQDAQAALAALQQAASIPESETNIGDKTAMSEIPDSESTSTANISKATATTVKPKKKPGAGKPKLTAKEKKERSAAIEKTVSCLPLEFRGSDPNLRHQIEAVIESFMDTASGKGVKLLELVRPPDLTQARVNKCLIALVNRKIVSKSNSTGQVLYHWVGV